MFKGQLRDYAQENFTKTFLFNQTLNYKVLFWQTDQQMTTCRKSLEWPLRENSIKYLNKYILTLLS